MERGARGVKAHAVRITGTRGAPFRFMPHEEESEPVWRTFTRGFGALPTWQKVAIAAIALMTAPGALLVLTVTVLSLFPLFLLGRFEGEGDQSLVHEVKLAAHRVHAHTEEVYSR